MFSIRVLRIFLTRLQRNNLEWFIIKNEEMRKIETHPRFTYDSEWSFFEFVFFLQNTYSLGDHSFDIELVVFFSVFGHLSWFITQIHVMMRSEQWTRRRMYSIEQRKFNNRINSKWRTQRFREEIKTIDRLMESNELFRVKNFDIRSFARDSQRSENVLKCMFRRTRCEVQEIPDFTR